MLSTTFILSVFASILRLLTMKPKTSLRRLQKHAWLGLTSSCSPSGPGTIQLGGLRGAWP